MCVFHTGIIAGTSDSSSANYTDRVLAISTPTHKFTYFHHTLHSQGTISQTKLHTSCFCLSSGTLSVHRVNHAQVFPSYKMPLHNTRIMCQAAFLLQNLYNTGVAVGVPSPPSPCRRCARSEVTGHRRSRLRRRRRRASAVACRA